MEQWERERESAQTLERIDQAFISNEWESLFPTHELQALPSLFSDHTPLLLHTSMIDERRRRFHFLPFWPRCEGFMEVVQDAWHCPIRGVTPFQKLDWLFRNTAWFLKSWSDHRVSNLKLQLEIAKEVVLRLEITRDSRAPAPHEESLWQLVKLRSFGLSSLLHTVTHQESHVLWLHEGDTPTKKIHMYVSVRQ
jgi:hypothetical protein